MIKKVAAVRKAQYKGSKFGSPFKLLEKSELDCKSVHSRWESYSIQRQRKLIVSTTTSLLFNEIHNSMSKKSTSQAALVNRPPLDVSQSNDFSKILGNLDARMVKFIMNATANTLCTASRRAWLYQSSDKCKLCEERQTPAHALSKCNYSLGNLGSTFNRYLWRHNEVLKALVDDLVRMKPEHLTLLADLPGHAQEYSISNPSLQSIHYSSYSDFPRRLGTS